MNNKGFSKLTYWFVGLFFGGISLLVDCQNYQKFGMPVSFSATTITLNWLPLSSVLVFTVLVGILCQKIMSILKKKAEIEQKILKKSKLRKSLEIALVVIVFIIISLIIDSLLRK